MSLWKCFEPTRGSTAQSRWTTAAAYQSGSHKLPAHLLKVPSCRGVACGCISQALTHQAHPAQSSVTTWAQSENEIWHRAGDLPLTTCRIPKGSGYNRSFIQANWNFSSLYLFRSQGRHTCVIPYLEHVLYFKLIFKPKWDWKLSIFTKASLNNTSLGNAFWIFGGQEACLSWHPENNWDHISNSTVKGL